jgi:hypothetical protein
MNTEDLKQFFSDHDFNVNLFVQDDTQCGEIETWTNNGVNMIHTLNPFTIEEFIEVVNAFDVDEEMDLHRQDERFKSQFTIRQALEDFEAYLERLESLKDKLTN